MAYEHCLLEVKNIAGRELTPDEQAQVTSTVERIIKNVDKEGLTEELSEAVRKAVDDWAVDLKAAAVIEKRNAVLNVRKKLDAYEYITNVFKDDPGEGVKALLGDSLVDRQGSKNGVAHHVTSLQHEYLGGLIGTLSKEGVYEIASNGKFDDQIFRAMYELNMDAPNPDILKKFPKEVIKVAEVFNKYSEMARNNANKSGAWIKKLPGYVVKRSHDMLKIAKAAGDHIPLNDKRHSDAWTDWVEKNLDWNKSMVDVPESERRKILESMFQQFSNGYHLKFGEGGTAGFKGAFNIGKKLSKERVLQFKTPELEYEYHKRFGQGDTLLENMGSAMTRMAQDTAIMTKLGPNARANLDEAIDLAMKKYDSEGRGELASKLKKDYDSTMSTLWPNITGETSIPGNEVWAQRSRSMRNWMMASDLAAATLSGLTDIPFAASVMRYTGDRTSGSFFNGMVDTVKGMVSSIGRSVDPNDLSIYSEAGILTDVLSEALGKFTSDVPGQTSKMVQMVMKFNGMNAWQDSIRQTSVIATANRHALHAQVPFDKLPEGMQSIMRQFDISPAEWDLYRNTQIRTDTKGNQLLTPENIRDADKEMFDSLPEVRERINQIKQKEANLIKAQELSDAKDDEFLFKRIDKVVQAKEKAIKNLDDFQVDRIAKTSSEKDWLNLQKEKVKARIEIAEVEADIAAYLKTEKLRDKQARFFDEVAGKAYKEGKRDAKRFTPEGFNVSEDTTILDQSAKRTDRYSRERGGLGENLGYRKGRAEAKIEALEARIKQAEKGLDKDLDARVKTTHEKLKSIDEEFDGYFKKMNEKLEARAARVKEYQDKIGIYIDHAREGARTKLKNNMRTMFSQIASMATSEPSVVERSIMNQGTRPGTWMGEAARHFWMYKSFTTSVMRKHIGRELIGYGAERLPAHQALGKMLTSGNMKGGFGGMVNMIAFGTLAGYGSMALKDLYKGREPRVPTDAKSFAKIFAASVAQSGSFGIYGDFLFGEAKDRYGQDAMSTLMGPTYRRGAEILDLFGKAKLKAEGAIFDEGGDNVDLGSNALRLAINNTPGHNLFYTKWALDYALIYRFQEMMNPGYLSRMEQNLKNSKQQEFLVPPSTVVPYGGGL